MLIALVAACRHEGVRCAHCGMKLDPASAWNAELDQGTDRRQFDTPRCALATWVADAKKGTVRVRDYYDRTLRPASDVRFVIGSDVAGPMGAELVPVDVARVAKFEKDHGGARALAERDIDAMSVRP